jgi:hypothetical protein
VSLKDRVHHLVDELPEPELTMAERFLQYLRATEDPVHRALLEAPWDNEPESEDERQAVQEARDELARGEAIPDAELWRSLGHEPPA